MTHEDVFSLLDPQRLADEIAAAVTCLDDDERQARIDYCRDTGRHGVTVVPLEAGWLQLRWGGRPLVELRVNALLTAGATPGQLN